MSKKKNLEYIIKGRGNCSYPVHIAAETCPLYDKEENVCCYTDSGKDLMFPASETKKFIYELALKTYLELYDESELVELLI